MFPPARLLDRGQLVHYHAVSVGQVSASAERSAPRKEHEVEGFVPRELFLTKGVGKHREKLSSFELALRSAGIQACNLVRVSSIFPPGCKILPRIEGIKHISAGQV